MFLRVLCSPLLHPPQWSHRNGTYLAENVQLVADFQPERLNLLHSALVTAKLASCMDFTNSTNGMDALAWNCLEAVNTRCIQFLRSGASEQSHPDDAKRHEVLSVLLIKVLLPVMQQSARAYGQLQYRAQAAVSMVLSIVHLGVACCPAIADAIIDNGKCFPSLNYRLVNAVQCKLYDAVQCKLFKVSSCASCGSGNLRCKLL